MSKLSLRVKLAYNAPQLVTAAMAIPILVHMTKFYTDVVMLPAGILGLSIAVARAFDALTDPAIGYLSDRTRTRFGRRKPWIAVAVLPMAGVFYLLFTPPASLTGAGAFAWFATCFTSYFLFHTLVVIPYNALATELTLDPKERASLFGMHSAAIALGTIVAAVLPSVLEAGGMHDERERFGSMALVYAVAMVVLFGVFLRSVREPAAHSRSEPNPFVPGVRRAFRNRPFRRLFVALLVYAIPSAIPATLMPFFVAYVLQPDDPTKWLGIYLVTYLGVGFLCLPIWVRVAQRIGKVGVWRICGSIGVLGGGALFLVDAGDASLAFWIFVFVGSQSAFFYFLGPAMLADCVDYDELHTGKRREAQYSAFWAFLPKFVAIPGTAIPFALLGMAGYVPNQPQTPEVLLTLKVLYALVPAVFNTLGLLLMWTYPLVEAVHREVRQGVASHQRGEVAIDPLTGGVVLPPAEDAEAGVAWFLDNFSHGELRRLLAGGAGSLVRGVMRMCAVWAGVSAIAIGYAVTAIDSLEREPGVVPVLAVVVAGVAVSATVFQMLRIRPALRVARMSIDPAIIRAHLGSLHQQPRLAAAQ